ncbi:hypothetical protein [Pseudoduganella aquatica]|uniref:Ribosomal protein S3AE n=1 Tax=Pseudoduganella aquatica TaxID=2660641 RepID=A0A7X4HFT4_9BURK|nr:hypothetical protein [Pseudoduganella aquatica]MYN10380.1 hypothetical protein [Pseudoduganella aquatica]
MLQIDFPIRKECPPGACDCKREQLLEDAAADMAALAVLRLTKEDEKRLIQRIEAAESYEDLQRIGLRLQENLGVALKIAPGENEVRTVMGLQIELSMRPGLCRKTREAIPAAVRRCLKKNPAIIYAILDAHDLFGV